MGKGNKERKVFINPRAKATIKIYLATRDDDNPALFVQRKCPSKRIQKGGKADLTADGIWHSCCPECGNILEHDYSFCPECGQHIKPED